MVFHLSILAADLAAAAGDKNGTDKRDAAKESAYFNLDMPFREWLSGIDPKSDDMNAKQEECMNAKQEEWLNKAHSIILALGKGLVSEAGTGAFIGRKAEASAKQPNPPLITSLSAYIKFKNQMSHIKKNG
jgi:CRISPR system Cascade subunit CasA